MCMQTTPAGTSRLSLKGGGGTEDDNEHERNMLCGGLGEELLAVEGESYFSLGVWPSLVVCPCTYDKQ